jgi:hypothetical protein
MTEIEARDELFAMLKSQWDSLAAPFNLPEQTTPPQIYWQGVDYQDPPPLGSPYARAHIVHSGGQQSSLGPVGGRLFERTGVIIVQCFAPTSSGKSGTLSVSLATIAKNAFEGRASPGGIWLRRCRISEVGSENGWFQVNAQAEFTYSEVK